MVTFEEVRKAREEGNGIIFHRPVFCPSHPAQQLEYLCATCQVNRVVFERIFTSNNTPFIMECSYCESNTEQFWSVKWFVLLVKEKFVVTLSINKTPSRKSQRSVGWIDREKEPLRGRLSETLY